MRAPAEARLSKKKWAEPQPDWLPLRQAPFVLLARNDEESNRNHEPSLNRSERVAENEVPDNSGADVVESDERGLEELEQTAKYWEQGAKRIEAGVVEIGEPGLQELEQLLAEKSGADRVEIDPKAAIFRFWFGGRLSGGEPWVILDPPKSIVDPQREAKALFDKRWIKADIEEAAREARQYRAVCEATSLVWRQFMLRALDRAVSSRAVALYVRPKMGEHFEHLPADVWPLLNVIDWRNGVAVAPDNTRYWSVHVGIVGKSVSTAQSLKPASNSAIQEAIKRVYDEAEIAGHKPPNIKELGAAAQRLLKAKGYRASGRQIMALGGAAEHAARRRPSGKTLLSERGRRPK